MSNARNLGNITTGGATGATTASVNTEVANLVDSAPGTLNTLNELAAALGDDANFSTTVTNSIATKMPLAGGTFAGNVRMSGNQINLAPSSLSDATISFNEPGDNIVIRNHNTSGTANSINIDTKSGSVVLRHVDAGSSIFHPMVEAKTNGSVDLYYDNSKKFETTNTGVTVTGGADASTFFRAPSFYTGVGSQGFVNTNTNDFKITNQDNTIAIYGQNGGNVGIGETSPANILHIKTSASGGPQIELDSTSGTANSAFINFDGTSLQLSTQRDMIDGSKRDTAKSWGGINIVGVAAGSYINFQTSEGANNAVSTKMTITKEGDVGIGATNPGGSKLYVQDTHTATVTDGTSMIANTTFTINGNSSSGSDVIRMGPMGTSGKQFIDVSNSAGSAAYDLLLNPIGSGNVGIGTTSAGAKLTITDENAGQASLQVRNFNTSATGTFTNNYNVEVRSATSTTTHGMLIHLNENNIGRRVLDISDSVGAQSSTIFASFVQGKVGINNTSPQGQLDIVVPQDKIPFIVRSGGKSNVGANSANFFHCYNSLGSSGTWYDVCYVSHSPNIFILGTTLQDGNPALGGSRWCSRMYGTYGSVAHTTFGGGVRTVAMNGGAITGFDYRYLNGGASSGSYRLQVLVNWSGAISTMEVYTTIMGNGTDTLQEDN